MEENNPAQKEIKKRHRGLWWKIPLWTVVTLVLLLGAVTGIGLWLLTPERLTALVNKYGTEFLHDGSVSTRRVELTWWSTFPRMELTVDSLAVRADAMPDSVATLLAVERIHGAVNLANLLKGAITVYDVTITRPAVCLYTGADGRSNLDIFPSSAEPDTTPSGPVIIPPLELQQFTIEGDAPLRYISEPDSLNALLTLRRLSVADSVPYYAVECRSLVQASPVELPDSFAVELRGNVAWRPDSPLSIGLHDFTLGAGQVTVHLNAEADLNTPPTLRSLTVATGAISPDYVAGLARMQPGLEIPQLQCGGKVLLSAELLRPYCLTDTLLPAVKARVELTDGPVSLPDMRLRLRNAALVAEAELADPSNLNKAVVTLRKLSLTGDRGATSVAMSGTATNLLADPAVNGHFTGNIILQQLPPQLLKAAGVTASGRLHANTDFRFRLSHLMQGDIHRLKLNGLARLSDFAVEIPADSLAASGGVAELRFGTSQSFVSDRGSVDSLLTVSLRLDTASAILPELTAALSDLKCGFGVRNDGTFTDTTTVTPMGGKFSLGRLRMISSADSMRAILRGVDATVRLNRHKGQSSVPEVGLGLTVRSIAYAQGLTRMTLRRSNINATMHLNKRRNRRADGNPRRFARHDSISARRPASRQAVAATETETIDFGLDKSMTSLLQRLQLDGSLQARTGRVFTPLYPLRMTMRGLDFHFTADSLNLHNVELTAGQSRFKAEGRVTNLRRALTSRRRKTPLQVRFNLHADTINVNELTQAAFRGAALAAKMDSTAGAGASQVSFADSDDDDALQQSVDSMALTEMAAILVPANIDADLRFSADNIIYSHMLMHDFTGTLLVNNGSVSLQQLHASTDAGSADLNALYYAPNRDDIDFALGLQLNRFRIDRVIELMPQLDSIMPILGTLGGIIDVGLGATVELDSSMNLKLPSLRAMMNLNGDSLVVLDEGTYKTMAKWLMFKDKKHNMIDHMDVNLAVENSMLELYPFMFDFDRYRLGVMGHNDLDLNLNYHVSVLKSPLPFKFGINITGPADNMKIRPGKARFKENMAAERVAIADSARVNLVQEMRSAFRRGVKAARVAPVRPKPALDSISAEADTLSADQLRQLEL